MQRYILGTHIAIGVPHLGNLPGYFVDSLLFLDRGDHDVNTVRVENKPVDTARNTIAKAFVGNKAFTHLLFLDADMIVPKSALMRLMARDRDIVSGTYFARTDTPIPHSYVFARTDENGINWYTSQALEFAAWLKRHPEQEMHHNVHAFIDPGDSLVECDAVGFGCVLIKREVFEAIEYPYFESDPETGGSEDFDFCEKAKTAGFQVWTDFSIQCNHELRGAFTGREEFMACWGIGTDDEFDFTQDQVEVEVRPSGQRRIRTTRRSHSAA